MLILVPRIPDSPQPKWLLSGNRYTFAVAFRTSWGLILNLSQRWNTPKSRTTCLGTNESSAKSRPMCLGTNESSAKSRPMCLGNCNSETNVSWWLQLRDTIQVGFWLSRCDTRETRRLDQSESFFKRKNGCVVCDTLREARQLTRLCLTRQSPKPIGLDCALDPFISRHIGLDFALDSFVPRQVVLDFGVSRRQDKFRIRPLLGPLFTVPYRVLLENECAVYQHYCVRSPSAF